MFLDQIRQHTLPCHDALVAGGGVVALTETSARYHALIEACYGFFAPIECRLSGFCFAVAATVGATRPRTEFLLTDLEAHGYSPSAIAALEICAELPSVGNRAAARGCAYVIEESSPGGRVLSRLIENRLDILPHSGGRILHGWGHDSDHRWRDFCSALEALADAAPPGESDRAIATAVATFNCLQRWLQHFGEQSHVG